MESEIHNPYIVRKRAYPLLKYEQHVYEYRKADQQHTKKQYNTGVEIL